ncbi:MAG: hypothetical protein O7B99_07570 [Planctomycetota bacterium]|nr:hypothetical protein [Planctomycetota bacterium]
MRSMLRVTTALALVGATATAQVGATVGPPVAPIGSPIAIAIANDGHAPVATGVCPFVVHAEDGNPVFAPICIAIAVAIEPGEVMTSWWAQVDDEGQQVPAGRYVVTVQLPTGKQSRHLVEIADVDAALTTLGPPKIGTERELYLTSPDTPNLPYMLVAASSAATGLPTCAGLLPLDLEALRTFSMNPAHGVLVDSYGLLDSSGQSTEPELHLPANPALVGLSFKLVFAVIDPAEACPIVAVSEALPLTVE